MARKKKTVRRTKAGARKRAASSRTSSVGAKRRTSRTTARAAKQPRRSAASGSAPENLSLAELQAEISSRVSDLHARRSELEREISEIDAALASAGGAAVAPARRGPGRPVGSRTKTKDAAAGRAPRKKKTGRRGGRTKGVGGKNLAESLYDVLKGKEMKVAQLVDAVQEAGYQTNSPNFRVMVSAALSRNKGSMFKNVRRGVYTTIG